MRTMQTVIPDRAFDPQAIARLKKQTVFAREDHHHGERHIPEGTLGRVVHSQRSLFSKHDTHDLVGVCWKLPGGDKGTSRTEEYYVKYTRDSFDAVIGARDRTLVERLRDHGERLRSFYLSNRLYLASQQANRAFEKDPVHYERKRAQERVRAAEKSEKKLGKQLHQAWKAERKQRIAETAKEHRQARSQERGLGR